MTDCQRPTGEACNCCNDDAIQHRLTEITQWIEQLEWRIAEIQHRPVGKDWQLTGCDGNTLALNASVATCSDLHKLRDSITAPPVITDCAGNVLAQAPSCAEFTALTQQITDIRNDITRLTQMVDSIPRPGGNQTPLPGIDQATIDGIQNDIKTIKDQITDLTGRIEALESSGGNSSGGGGACDFATKWGVTASVRSGGKDDERFYVSVGVTGSPLKLATVMLSGHQQVVCLDETGSYAYQYSAIHTAGNLESTRAGGVRLIHCGRNVAASDVQG